MPSRNAVMLATAGVLAVAAVAPAQANPAGPGPPQPCLPSDDATIAFAPASYLGTGMAPRCVV
ncbi:MAG: hypothetical protein ACRELA_07720, partial [Candidatus Rokuibacteriota bacterium]